MITINKSLIKYKKPAQLVLLVCCCLIPLTPLFDNQAINVQHWLLSVAVVISLSLLLLNRTVFKPKNTILLTLISVLVVCCIINYMGNRNSGNLVSFTVLDLLACIVSGLGLINIPKRWLFLGLYSLSLALAFTEIPYSYFKYQQLTRPGGIIGQADILAVFLGGGLIVGHYLYKNSFLPKKLLLFSQFVIAVMLLLTQTRFVIAFLAVALIIYIFKNYPKRIFYFSLSLLVLATAMYGFFASSRLTSIKNDWNSITYRLDLDKAAISGEKGMPFNGYGVQAFPIVLGCPRLAEKPLIKTCHQGYAFNSSHNIYLDRWLGLGWIGGIAYLAIVVLAISKLIIKKQVSTGIYALLIAIYYLVNITLLPLELIFWVMLAQSLNNTFKADV